MSTRTGKAKRWYAKLEELPLAIPAGGAGGAGETVL